VLPCASKLKRCDENPASHAGAQVPPLPPRNKKADLTCTSLPSRWKLPSTHGTPARSAARQAKALGNAGFADVRAPFFFSGHCEAPGGRHLEVLGMYEGHCRRCMDGVHHGCCNSAQVRSIFFGSSLHDEADRGPFYSLARSDVFVTSQRHKKLWSLFRVIISCCVFPTPIKIDDYMSP